MTTEEKAKAYDEALKRAKAAIDMAADKDLVGGVVRTIFPELRESEDERIRKLLVWQVYRNIEDETNDLAQSVYDGIKGHDPDIEESIEDWKKCLAYLEKQKEQKPAEVKDPFSNANFVRGYESGYADAKREQKPAQTSEEKEYIRTLKSLISDFIRDKKPEDVIYYQRVYDWLDGRHVEQEPNIELIQRSWYMEGYHDREFGKEPKWIIKTGEGGPKHELNPKYGQPLAEEQKPAEWSEEDEEIIDAAYCWLCEYAGSLMQRNYGKSSMLYGIANKLKSLRPSWKPSEEEMNGLAHAINLDVYDAKRYELDSLYNDLKKLM